MSNSPPPFTACLLKLKTAVADVVGSTAVRNSKLNHAPKLLVMNMDTFNLLQNASKKFNICASGKQDMSVIAR